MKLQSEVITQLSVRFGAPKNVRPCAEIEEYKGILDVWFRTLPAVYDIDGPDVNKNLQHPWVTFHYIYLHTTRRPISTSSELSCPGLSVVPQELRVRADGFFYST